MNVERNGEYVMPWPARAFWALAIIALVCVIAIGIFLYRQIGESAIILVLGWLSVPLGLSAIAAVIDLLGGIQYNVERMANAGPVKVKVQGVSEKKEPKKPAGINVPADLRAMQEKYGYADSWWITDMEDDFLSDESINLDAAVDLAKSRSIKKVRMINVDTPQNWYTVRI